MDAEIDASSFPLAAPTRAVSAAVPALRALALANVLYLQWNLLGDVLEGTQNAPPRAVAIGLALLSGLPWLAALALLRAARGTLAVEAERLVLELGRTRFEIPLDKVRELRGSSAPWAAGALALGLASGKSFERRLVADDPRGLAAALKEALPEVRAALPAASFAYAAELRARTGRPRWLLPIKVGVAPLGLALIAFRLQQIIMFGGPLGQYHQAGLGAYLLSFLDTWVSAFGDLILYAAGVRFAVELAAIGVTWLAPRAARPARLGAEGLAFIAFFVVVPGFLALRLLG